MSHYVGGDVSHTLHKSYFDKHTTQDARNGVFVVEGESHTWSAPAIGYLKDDDLAGTITANSGEPGETQTPALVGQAIGFNCMQDTTEHIEVVPTISTGNQQGISNNAVATGLVVRRLTPLECERLQGFPDGYTLIAWNGKDAENCPDGPRYRALGNSMAVPVMRWIGEGIGMVHRIPVEGQAKSGVQEWL